MRPSNHLVSAVHIIYGNYLVELMLKRICINLELWRQSYREQQEQNINTDDTEEDNIISQQIRRV
jgi:hypothetical protein